MHVVSQQHSQKYVFVVVFEEVELGEGETSVQEFKFKIIYYTELSTYLSDV